MRVFTSFLMTTLMVWTLSTASAASPEVICEPVKHCVSILKTHDADSFDYEVLRSEFVRYGEAGKQALLKMASGRDDEQSQRALFYHLMTWLR